jgi:hypothetical protein
MKFLPEFNCISLLANTFAEVYLRSTDSVFAPDQDQSDFQADE